MNMRILSISSLLLVVGFINASENRKKLLTNSRIYTQLAKEHEKMFIDGLDSRNNNKENKEYFIEKYASFFSVLNNCEQQIMKNSEKSLRCECSNFEEIEKALLEGMNKRKKEISEKIFNDVHSELKNQIQYVKNSKDSQYY